LIGWRTVGKHVYCFDINLQSRTLEKRLTLDVLMIALIDSFALLILKCLKIG